MEAAGLGVDDGDGEVNLTLVFVETKKGADGAVAAANQGLS